MPSTPLKESERRADSWKAAMGVEQTEIDALATLNPDLLRQIVLKATRPFYDPGLDDRVREARREWEQRAGQVLEREIGQEQLERLRLDAEAKLDDLTAEIEALNDALRVDEIEGIDLPDIPDIPAAKVDGSDGKPSPLIDSGWSFAEQSRRLKAYRAYELPAEGGTT